jgi:hypothetical protein
MRWRRVHTMRGGGDKQPVIRNPRMDCIATRIGLTILFIVHTDVLLARHLQVLMQHQLTRPTFILLVAHVTFLIIGCSQALERFLNGNLVRGWVSMLDDRLLMLPMSH